MALAGCLLLAGWGCRPDEQPRIEQTASAPTGVEAAAVDPREMIRLESVRVEPREPRPGSALSARAEGPGASQGAARLVYVWRVNGEEVARGPRSNVILQDLRRGDRVEVAVVATDGLVESEPVFDSVWVANRPPTLHGVQVDVARGAGPEAAPPRPGDRLVAVPEARDPDGDALRYAYTWFVHGVARGHEREFSTHGLRRGDRVHVRVRASDGEAETPALESTAIELGSTAPRITGVPPLELEDGEFRYAFEAVHDAGDRNLRFWLEEAPEGMWIDPVLGVLRWRPRDDQVGTHAVEVGVRDARGDGSTFAFEVTVAEQVGEEPARGDDLPASAELP